MSEEARLLQHLKDWLGKEAIEYTDEQLLSDIRHACSDLDAYARARNLESLGYQADYNLVEAMQP